MLRGAAVGLVVGALALASAELVLRIVDPPPSAIGIDAPKTEAYGWAWPPRTEYRSLDPDTGELVTTITNGEGWKDVEHERLKPPGTIRILVLGDTVTWGSVSLPNLYTRGLESVLRERGNGNVEVLSIAAPGWGTDQELEALVREGLSYRPDFVVYQFSGNDVLNNISPNGFIADGRIEWSKRFRYELRDAALRRVELAPRSFGSPMERASKWLAGTALGRRATAVSERWFPTDRDPVRHPPLPGEAPLLDAGDPYFLYGEDGGSPLLAEAWTLLAALVVEMRDRALAEGAEFLVFSEEGDQGKKEHFLSHRWIRSDRHGDFVVRDGLRATVRWTAPLERLRQLCRDAGVALVEPRRRYARYRNDPLPSVAGNRAMALDLADALEPRVRARREDLTRTRDSEAPLAKSGP